MSWESYLPSLTQNADGKQTCVGAMILDLNGNPLAKSPDLDLLAYDHEMQLDDGTTKKVAVNEFNILVSLIKTGKHGSEAGIRFSKKKFMDVTKPDSTERYFKGSKCGAILTKLKTTAIFVMWDELKGHSPAGVADQVGKVFDYLRGQGL